MPTLQCTNLKATLNKANTPNQVTVNLDHIYASATNWKSIKSKLSKNLGSLQSISFTPKKEKSLSDPEIVSKLPIKPSFIVDFSNKPLIYDYINVYDDNYPKNTVYFAGFTHTFEPLSKTPYICRTSYSEISRSGTTEYYRVINIKCARILLFKINLENFFYGTTEASVSQEYKKEFFDVADLTTPAYKSGLTNLIHYITENPHQPIVPISRYFFSLSISPPTDLMFLCLMANRTTYTLYKSFPPLSYEKFYYLILIVLKNHKIEAVSIRNGGKSRIKTTTTVNILSVSPYGVPRMVPSAIISPFFDERENFYFNDDIFDYFVGHENIFDYLETPVVENHKKVVRWMTRPIRTSIGPSVSWYEFYVTDLISDWPPYIRRYSLYSPSLAHKVIPLARKIGEIVEKEFKYESEGSQITLFYDGPIGIVLFVGRLVFLFKIQTVRFLRKYVLMTLPCLLSFSNYNTKLTYKRLLRVSHISLSLLYQTLNLYFNKLINLNKLILHFNFIGLKWFFLNNLQLSINLPNLTLLRGFIGSVDFLSLVFSFQTKLLKNYAQRTDFIILQLINTTLLDKLQFLSLNYYFPNIKFWYIKSLLRTISTQLSCSGNVLLLKSFTVGLKSKKCGS